MKKTYVLVPLIGVLIFLVIHWNFQAGFDAQEAKKKEAREKARQEKVQADIEGRRKAAEDAIELQEKRKKEKALKDAQEQSQKDTRLALTDAREKAYRDRDKNAKQVERLKADIAIEKDAIAKVEKSKAAAAEEDTFLHTYVKQAETNKVSLEDVLNKIKGADEAAAAAAAKAAADAAAKKASS
jgi:hypothetical protein